MTVITDEWMRETMATARHYSLVILKAGPNRYREGVERIIWEHGRRNLALREDGRLSIVCPVGGEVAGIGIFNVPLEEVHKIMGDDPGVKAGVFIYEAYVCRGLPGDSLPGPARA